MKYLQNIKKIEMSSKSLETKKIENEIGDDGCDAIFDNAKYITNLETLHLESKMFNYFRLRNW